MNIVVLLRALRDPASFSVNRRAQKIFVHRDLHRLNPADNNALEAALALAGASAGGSVAALACGGEPAGEALYQARAMGAGRALWVKDEALQPADGAVVTRVVQQALARLGGADLVLLGADVLDADLAQVGPRLAAAQGWPFVEAGYQVRAAPGSQGRLQVVLAKPDGYQAVEIGLPAVVSIAVDSNKPRYAPAPSIMRAYADLQALDVVSPAELGLDQAALAARVDRLGESFPPERAFGERLEGTLDDVAAQLAARLRR